MTKEDKALLLKDLCARLPYGVKALYSSYGYKKAKKDFVCSIIEIRVIADKAVITCSDNHLLFYIHEKDLETLKPYLRPMSSMTEEEKKKYKKVCDLNMEILENHPMNGEPFPALYNSQDWLNANHFDYRGLIKKNLALEAPEGMYK